MYTWISPLMQLGSRTNYVLQESDVWNLSPTMRSKAVYTKFTGLQLIESSKVPPILRRLWIANRHDILIDLSLTYVGIALEFLRPLCLKFILDELSAPDNTGESGRVHRANALIYSALELVVALLKAQIDGAASGFRVGKVKVEIWLVKRVQARWGNLVSEGGDERE